MKIAVLLAALAALLSSTATASQIPIHDCSGANYTSPRSYHRTLESLSSSLPGKASRAPRLLARDCAGTDEATYALAQCRGDIDSESCSSCVDEILQYVLAYCGLSKEVLLAYELCTLQLSGTAISWSSEVKTSMTQPDTSTVQSSTFEMGIDALISGVASLAANNSQRFATAVQEMDTDGRHYTAYGLAQCTPELAPADCAFCLKELRWAQRLIRASGGWFATSWCSYNTHLYKFFESEPMQLPAVTSNTTSGDGKKKRRVILGVSIGVSVAVVLISLSLLAWVLLRRKRCSAQKMKKSSSEEPKTVILISDEEECLGAPTAQQTARDAPTAEETAPDAPTAEQTAPEAPTAEQTAARDAPTAEQTAACDAPTAEQTARDAPTAEQTARDAPAAEHTAPGTPTAEQTAQTARDAPTAEQTAHNAPTAEHTARDAPTVEQTAHSAPTVEHTACEALPSAIESFDEIIARAYRKRILLFLDYDGTLAKIVKIPSEAFISEEMRETVRAAALLFRTSIVTGRDVPKAINFVQLQNLHYAGSHGMDIKIEEHYQPLPHLEPIVTKATKCLEKALQGVDGASVENNKFCVSVHFRNVDKKDWGFVEDTVNSVLSGFPDLKLASGKMVWELRSKVDFTKGDALDHLFHYLLQHLQTDRSQVLAIHIGDDKTDEDAFKVLREKGYGFGILVTTEPKPTQAVYSLEDPSKVMEFLQQLVRWREEEDGIVGLH